MPTPASNLSKNLIGHFRRLDSTRSKLEKLHASGDIKRHDIEQVYVGIYMDAIVSFERFIEELFFGYLTGRFVRPSHIRCRVDLKSSVIARDLVLGGKSYVDWLPFHHTEKRSAAFFRQGDPFTTMSTADKATIEKLMLVRNALAHQSHHSVKQFEKRILQGLALTGRERSPAGYLRTFFRMFPAQTRYESLVFEMALIANRLAH